MNLQENNHPLDDMFRQSFSSLPPEPDASGWDTPSERVWQGVQAGIKPIPKSGIGNTALWGGAIALIAGSALVWAFLSRPNPVETPISRPVEMAPVTAPIAEPAQPMIAPGTTANETPVKTEISKTTPKPIKKPEPAAAIRNSTEKNTPAAPQNSGTDRQRLKPGSSLPLPGTTTEPHNTTEKKKKAGG